MSVGWHFIQETNSKHGGPIIQSDQNHKQATVDLKAKNVKGSKVLHIRFKKSVNLIWNYAIKNLC